MQKLYKKRKNNKDAKPKTNKKKNCKNKMEKWLNDYIKKERSQTLYLNKT